MADTSAFLPVSQPQDGAGSVDGLLKDLNELLDSDGSISSVKDNANQNLVGCAQTMQENIDIMGSTDPIGQRDRLEQLYHSYNNRCAEVERSGR